MGSLEGRGLSGGRAEGSLGKRSVGANARRQFIATVLSWKLNADD